jgi:H+/Cl- antiporter ClcA
MSSTPAVSPARALLPLVLPAAVVGVACSLLLIGVSELAGHLEDFLWDTVPSSWFDISGTPWGWILLMLSLTGVAVGVVVWKDPHHAGPDPATEGLVSPPLAPAVVPGLLLTVMLSLAGGVSLGPENPITAANIALAFAFGPRLVPAVKGQLWVMLAAAGTIGALFGTPVAAALVLSEMRTPGDDRPLWDQLFAPLVAAGAGALTTAVLAQPGFSVSVEPYRGAEVIDLVSGSIIAVGAALLTLLLVYAFPYVHAFFRRIAHPVAMIGLGGVILGVIGAVGGPITLFKGLDQMKQLTDDAGDYSRARLVLIIGVKLLALLIAASCGFRGGRIFPAVFVGVAMGVLANNLVSSVPESLAIVAAVLGVLVVVTRSGWLSLFMAGLVVNDIRLMPVLCILILPVWLVATGKPELLLEPEPHPAPA